MKVKERIRFSWEKPLGGGASTLNENIWYGIFRFRLKLYNSAVITLKKLIRLTQQTVLGSTDSNIPDIHSKNNVS